MVFMDYHLTGLATGWPREVKYYSFSNGLFMLLMVSWILSIFEFHYFEKNTIIYGGSNFSSKISSNKLELLNCFFNFNFDDLTVMFYSPDLIYFYVYVFSVKGSNLIFSRIWTLSNLSIHSNSFILYEILSENKQYNCFII